MSYGDYQVEHTVKAADDLTASAGVRGEFTPMYSPVRVKAVGIVFTEVPGNNNLVTEFNHRPTAGSSSGETQIAAISATAAQGAAGLVRFTDGLDQLVKPGESITFEVTTATATTGIANAVVFVQPAWENPANNSDMTEVAAP